jgi:selenocysteine lyase/cysteine desulfurase
LRRDGHDLGAAGQLVLITHMPTHVGTITDIEWVGRILAGSGALFVVDVAQTLGQMPLDLHRIGAMSPSPRRKFLRAPRGTGVAYVRAALAERLVPLTPPLAPSAALVGHR